MIDAIKEPLEIDKIIRKVLIEQSELKSKRVLNAISVRGQNLSKLINENEYSSYTLNDTFIIFETLSNPSSNNNVVMEEDDDTITCYSSFYIKILIYGNNSPQMVNKLKSRLLSREVIDNLYNEGIHIEKISNPEPIHEWLNETLWVRNDLTMQISCRESFEKINSDYIIDKIGDLNLKETK